MILYLLRTKLEIQSGEQSPSRHRVIVNCLVANVEKIFARDINTYDSEA